MKKEKRSHFINKVADTFLQGIILYFLFFIVPFILKNDIFFLFFFNV